MLLLLKCCSCSCTKTAIVYSNISTSGMFSGRGCYNFNYRLGGWWSLYWSKVECTHTLSMLFYTICGVNWKSVLLIFSHRCSSFGCYRFFGGAWVPWRDECGAPLTAFLGIQQVVLYISNQCQPYSSQFLTFVVALSNCYHHFLENECGYYYKVLPNTTVYLSSIGQYEYGRFSIRGARTASNGRDCGGR